MMQLEAFTPEELAPSQATEEAADFLRAVRDAADIARDDKTDILIALWTLHSRKCRRWLEKRKKIQPDDPRHLVYCKCGWPQARLDQFATSHGRTS